MELISDQVLMSNLYFPSQFQYHLFTYQGEEVHIPIKLRGGNSLDNDR